MKEKFLINKIIKSQTKIKYLAFAVILFISCGVNAMAQSNVYEGVKFTFSLTNGVDEEAKTSFASNEEIVINTLLENNSNELFPYLLMDNLYQYRFSLIRESDKKTIAYRTDKADILSIREEKPGVGRKLLVDPVFPGATQKLAVMKLGDRYENLTPDNYKLSIEYKTGKLIDNGQNGQKRLSLIYFVLFEITQ